MMAIVPHLLNSLFFSPVFWSRSLQSPHTITTHPWPLDSSNKDLKCAIIDTQSRSGGVLFV